MKTLFIIFLFFLVSCKPVLVTKGTGGFSNKTPVVPSSPVTGSSITLVTPATSPNFISAITLTVNGIVSGETINLYSDASCITLISSKIATASSASFTTGALSVGVHNFYTLSTNSVGSSHCSASLFSYNYLGIAPTIASSIALFSPTTSPEYISTPTFLLNGVVSGETIKLYNNSSCTQQVGGAVALGSSIQISSTALAPGTYYFYTTSTNAAGASACSTISASYQYFGVLPTTATTMTLSSPAGPSNYVSTPIFLVYGGVANGDTVKVYTDSTCATLVGSTLSTGASVSVTVSALLVGAHNFYTKSTNILGTSSCSTVRATYNYLGASPVIQVSWNANRESAVNKALGGYRVYYSTTSGFNIATATYVDVPYVSGPSSPLSTTFNNFLVGTYYFKVVAFSPLNPVGGSTGSKSLPSSEFSVSLP